MQNSFIFHITVLVYLVHPSLALADLKVILTREANLPSYLTPSASSSHKGRSVPRVFTAKKPHPTENVPSPDSKGRLSKIPYGDPNKKRLLLARNGRFFTIGSYTEQKGGGIDFYTADGRQIIYSPKRTDALYRRQDNAFCGSLIKFGKTKVVALTELGRAVLEKDGISLSNPSDHRQPETSKKSSRGLNRHWIQENIQQGRMIVLENGSIWKINPTDKLRAGKWKSICPIAIVPSNENRSGYDYLLINMASGAKVKAKFLGRE